ncbi:MAG: sugar phosphate isomerase/epimerase, partial [Planctomycetes bacterium]|nr:sugar phosphate isomerase/epimerase [Planctomycetota bacterium]
DPIRFVKEFVDDIYHVHGKDTLMYQENIYECGYERSGIRTTGHDFGSQCWRYTIPGQGVMPWSEAFSVLKENNYQGKVSIELEDENFNGTEAGEKQGIIEGVRFLQTC